MGACGRRFGAMAGGAHMTASAFDVEFPEWVKWRNRLIQTRTPEQRAMLAWFALSACGPEQAAQVALAYLDLFFPSAELPLPFLAPGDVEEACFWASTADRLTLRAMAVAAFKALPGEDQRALCAWMIEPRAGS